jgi:hypothetical protein
MPAGLLKERPSDFLLRLTLGCRLDRVKVGSGEDEMYGEIICAFSWKLTLYTISVR